MRDGPTTRQYPSAMAAISASGLERAVAPCVELSQERSTLVPGAFSNAAAPDVEPDAAATDGGAAATDGGVAATDGGVFGAAALLRRGRRARGACGFAALRFVRGA